MIINLLPQKDFPFGNNIHFVFSVSSRKFLFVHPFFDWVFRENPDRALASLLSAFAPEDVFDLNRVFQRLLAGSFSGDTTISLSSLRGQRWIRVTPLLAEIQNQRVIAGSATEVTAEITNLQTVTKFTEKKNSILNMLGHDLRGPLNIAKSLTKAITRQLEDPSLLEKTSNVTDILQESIEMISNLVQREFLETVGAELVKQRFNIVKLLKDYLEECKLSQHISEISFELNTATDELFIELDRAKFVQVVNNLISNSLKFTPSGGKISVSVIDSADQVSVVFSDTGIGIPESLLPKIFEKFTAARRTGLAGEPSTGLGLSIVKTIISWHQGTIKCESREGKGTRFFVSLPKTLHGQGEI